MKVFGSVFGKAFGVIACGAALILAAGCTSSHGKPAPTTSGSPTCTASTAKPATQTFVTADGFSPSCVAIKTGSLFSIVNGSSADRKAVTQPGAPSTFVADLPHQNSTFSQTFKKKGTYAIVDQTTAKTMTLFVQ